MTAPARPYWPRLMKLASAADYCDLAPAAFEREVFAGKFPPGLMVGGKLHWDIRALDKAIDALTGGEDEPEWRRNLKERFGEAA